MISAYHRPQTIEEALALLARSDMNAVPMGGGSALNRLSPEPFAVVDLQDLGLNSAYDRGNFLDLGATLTLQVLLEAPRLPPALRKAIQHEASYNLRQVATVAGTLVSATGRSPFATAMLALDASLLLMPGEEQVDLGDLLSIRKENLRGRLITRVTIPLNARLAYEYVARTPADQPIVCASAAQWPSSRTRVALGGYGAAPLLALDGPEPGGAEIAAHNAYSQAGDEWASADYRQEIAEILTRRCLKQIESKPDL